MLAGVNLGWPSNTRPLHDIVANQFEWRRHCQPAVLVPFGLLARPVTDRGLTPVMGLVWLRYSAASSPAARVELVRAAGVRMRREGCPPMGPLDCKYSGGGTSADGADGTGLSHAPRVRSCGVAAGAHGPGRVPGMGQGAQGRTAAGCGLAIVYPAPTTGQGNKAPARAVVARAMANARY